MLLPRFVLPAVLVAGTAALTGCTVRTSPEPVYATTEVSSAQIETYPSTVYEGRNVYLYNDHWYYRDRGRWAYYASEPAPLQRRRHYVQTAPPVARGPRYAAPQSAPAAPRHAPAQSAPPAVRVQ